MRAPPGKLAELTKLLREVEIEVKSLERAAELRPAADAALVGVNTASEAPQPTKRGGRQPGAISHKWRDAMGDIVAAGNKPLDIEQIYLLTRGRLGLAETAIRERVRQYVSQGIMTEIAGKFCVSDATIEKYKLGDPDADQVRVSIDSGHQNYPRVEGVEHNEKAPH